MEASIYILVMSMATLIYMGIVNKTLFDIDKVVESSYVGNKVVQIANGYARKIVDYESEVGESFLGLNVGDELILQDEAVYRALKSDGSLIATEPAMLACTDSAGVVTGTAKRAYVPCELPEFVPGGTNKRAYARFVRVNLTTVPDTYTTGYSQIEGVIYIGSRGENESFAFNEGDARPSAADKIADWVSAKGIMINTSNVLTAPVIDVTTTEAGALKIEFQMVQNNQMALRPDGSVPRSGNQNYAQNSIDDLKGINFSSLNGGSVVDIGSIDAVAASGTDYTLTLNSDNKLVFSASESISINSNDIYINGRLAIVGNTVVTGKITSDDFESTGNASVTNTLTSDVIEARVANYTEGVTAEDFESGNGAKLSYQIQSRGVVPSGSLVNDITCTTGSQQLLASIVDITPDGRPLTGWSIVPSRPTPGATTLTIRTALEDGTVKEAPTTSYMNYEQWCG